MTDPDRSRASADDDVVVRAAHRGELPAVLNVLDGAALETDAANLRAVIGDEDGTVLVAESDDPDGTTDHDPPLLGALVLDGDEIWAVAVRRRRRDQGIGTALVSAAAGRRERLVAEFDGDVRPFYASLGFDVDSLGEGRFGGVLQTG